MIKMEADGTIIFDSLDELFEYLNTKPEPETTPEEPAPTWTPEAGMLLASISDNDKRIWEIVQKDESDTLSVISLTGEKGLMSKSIRPNYRPIAELEGLKVGDKVYHVNYRSEVSSFAVAEIEAPLLFVTSFDTKLVVSIKGFPTAFGNGKQMFWRTAERAERFGR